MSEGTLHRELKHRAAIYALNKGYWICGEEVPMPLGICDAWGMSRADGLQTIGIEVKTSRQDFRSRSQRYKEYSSRALGNYQYILCPSNLIQVSEVHKEWGLLWWDGERMQNKKKAPKMEMSDREKLEVLLYFLTNGFNEKRPRFPTESNYTPQEEISPTTITQLFETRSTAIES